MPGEGGAEPTAKPSEARCERGGSPGLCPVRGVLNQRQNRAKRGVSGEARRAYAR